jgi:hypothetical protein
LHEAGRIGLGKLADHARRVGLRGRRRDAVNQLADSDEGSPHGTLHHRGMRIN